MSGDARPRFIFNSVLLNSSRLLILLGLLIFVIPFIALLFYASMNTDDFAKSTFAFVKASPTFYREPGVLKISWAYYTLGTGRWVTSLVQCFVMSKVNLITYYGWLLLLVMVSNIAGLAYFIANFFRVNRYRALLVAGLFYAVWLSSVATPIEGVYWLTEAFEYQLSLTTMFFLAGLLCKSRHSIYGYIALAGLAIAIPGQHELAGAVSFVCLLAGLVAARIQKVEIRQWLLSFGLLALSFAAIMLSPGKALQFAQGHKVPWTLVHFLPYARRVTEFGIGWILSTPILIFALCVPILLWPRSVSGEADRHVPPRWLALGSLGAMAALLGIYASAEMSSGYGALGPRTVGWAQYVFWLLFVCAVTIGLPELARINFSEPSRIGILLLLAISLLGSANFHTAEKDWRGPAGPYWKASVARLQQRGDYLVFDPLPTKPALVRESSVSMSPTCWVNQCFAFYVGAKTVVVNSPIENPTGCGFEH